MSQFSFANRTLVIASILIACHFLMLALRPCSQGGDHKNCHVSIETADKNQDQAAIEDYIRGLAGNAFPPLSSSYISDVLKPRHSFKSYQEYLHLQLQKTLNPNLRKLWTSKDWRRKVDVFSVVFQRLMKARLLKSSDKALCIAARVGQEVVALREAGVNHSIGVDLVASPPLVMKGDMHRLPFESNTFDFEYSNAFDHALFPAMFASEVERTLKPGGVLVLHVALKRRPDKFSANDLRRVDALFQLFKNFSVAHVRDVDVFGLDTEVALRKHRQLAKRCEFSVDKQESIKAAEQLITEEPRKPWLTFKQNLRNVNYLPDLQDISNRSNYIYIDVGARSYGSSIGSWFVKRYPKQNHVFSIYAVEADIAFAREYSKHRNVQFLPFAAWLRNESLIFGVASENRAVEGDIGMGRIQERSFKEGGDNIDTTISLPSYRDMQTVQGFDFAEWLMRTVSKGDFVVMKMDIEGTEIELLPRMLETGAMCLVDELFLECHYNRWQRTSPRRTSKYKSTYSECLSLFQALRRNGVLVHQWG